jgi:hypothetical protein
MEGLGGGGEHGESLGGVSEVQGGWSWAHDGEEQRRMMEHDATALQVIEACHDGSGRRWMVARCS